ncbi:MAG: hypothetical protein ABSD29_23750 [Verrucomicrobiota bacterium]
MKSLENIASAALLLPIDQRFTLAHRILASVEPERDVNQRRLRLRLRSGRGREAILAGQRAAAS